MSSLLDVSVRPAVRFPAPVQGLMVPSLHDGLLRHQPDDQQSLTVRVLRTPAERECISHLRQLADFKSEYALDPGLAAFEKLKDEVAVVMALCLDSEPIATIRFVPCGYGITMTERYWRDQVTNPEILATGSWEVGRLVMAPENRRSDLLPQCLALAGLELLHERDVEHLHASCLMSMTRLYRRFGYKIHCTRTDAGKDVALIHGTAEQICSRLRLPQSMTEQAHAPAFQNAVSTPAQLLQ